MRFDACHATGLKSDLKLYSTGLRMIDCTTTTEVDYVDPPIPVCLLYISASLLAIVSRARCYLYGVSLLSLHVSQICMKIGTVWLQTEAGRDESVSAVASGVDNGLLDAGIELPHVQLNARQQ